MLPFAIVIYPHNAVCLPSLCLRTHLVGVKPKDGVHLWLCCCNEPIARMPASSCSGLQWWCTWTGGWTAVKWFLQLFELTNICSNCSQDLWRIVVIAVHGRAAFGNNCVLWYLTNYKLFLFLSIFMQLYELLLNFPSWAIIIKLLSKALWDSF